jgi:hypothetical protein
MGMVILNTKLAGKTPRADSNLSWVSGTLENPNIVDRGSGTMHPSEKFNWCPHPTIH